MKSAPKTTWIPLLALLGLAISPSVQGAGNACSLANVPKKLQQEPLQVPQTERPVLKLFARGTQNYLCKATKDATGNIAGYAWDFTGPAAQLYGDATYSRAKLVGTHFAGPTWEAADGSRFVGNGKTAAKAASSKPLSDIPWLSIKRAESTAAPVPGLNSGLFEPFSYVQRGDTEGGIPSANDLCDADHVDQAIQVDYKASYYFYASKAAYPVARECGEPHRAATSVAAASAKTPVKVIAQ